MELNQFGYIRVSTKEQHTDRQLAALEPYQIPQKNLYCDYQSGKDFQRPAYQKLLKRLKKGDLLIIKSIDRLGRDYNEILNQWQFITKTICADILVIDMPLLDTRTKEGGLTGVLWRTWCCRFWPMLLKQSLTSSGSGRQRALPPQRRKAQNSDGRLRRCLTSLNDCISYGQMATSRFGKLRLN